MTTRNKIESAQEGELFDELYAELKKIAASYMQKERSNHTLQPTALVNEAYIKLISNDGNNRWKSKKHFLCTAAEVMRQVLIDSARSRNSKKRGGDFVRVELDDTEGSSVRDLGDILSIHDALLKLKEISPEKYEIVNLRFFAGLTIDETADVMNIARSTANKYWALGRTWLYLELTS